MTHASKEPWRVIWTRSRFEKSVAEALSSKNHIVFLPLRKEIRQWSDRRKKIEVPLFPNYIFVRAVEADFQEILKIPGVVKLIQENNRPAIIRESQMRLLKKLIENSDYPELEFQTLDEGSNITIRSGPLRGLSGVLVERKGKYKLGIRISEIKASILVEIDVKQIVRHIKNSE